MTKVYKYAMVYRPAGLGTVPKDGFIGSEERPAPGEPHHDTARNGVALFSRELTGKETRAFEMAPMSDEATEQAVEAVVGNMQEYDTEYLHLAESKPEYFERAVFVFHRTEFAGYPASIGNRKAFLAMVTAKLKLKVGKS